jgi:hypothetical protein
MSDISKCDKSNCPKSATCYRFTAPDNLYRQSYMSTSFDENGCDSYWSTESKVTEYVIYSQDLEELFVVGSNKFFNTKTLPKVTVDIGDMPFLDNCVVVGIL